MVGVGGLAATAPANAQAVDGLTIVTFNKATWKALDKGGIMVEGYGKAAPINKRSLGFPAEQSKPLSSSARAGFRSCGPTQV